MMRYAVELIKPLRVIRLGLDRKTQLEEIPSGAIVGILRESLTGECVDLAYENERYFALKSHLLSHSEGPGHVVKREDS